MKELPASISEREFVRACERYDKRHDGREVDQFRELNIQKLEENNYMACLGETKVAVSVQALPFKPERGRQNRGDLMVQLTYMPTASKANMDVQINKNRVRTEESLQTLLRASGVIDTRFLLIEQYEAALQLVIRVHVINDGGGIVDAAMSAAVVALANYKVPKHKYEDGVFKKVSINSEWPEKLRIFCHAYVITVGFFNKTFILDPDERESLYCDGFLRIGCTEKSTIYAMKEDGDQVSMNKEIMTRLCDLALNRVTALEAKLQPFFKDSRLL